MAALQLQDTQISAQKFLASLSHMPDILENLANSVSISVPMATAIRALHNLNPTFNTERLLQVPTHYKHRMSALLAKVNHQIFFQFMHEEFDILEEHRDAVDAVFDAFDPLREGYQVLRNILNGFAQLLCRSVQEQTQFLFHLFDVNGNGQLDADELVHMLLSTGLSSNQQAASVLAMLHQMDEDGDGQVTQEEFRRRAVRAPLVVQTMERFFAVPLQLSHNPEDIFIPRKQVGDQPSEFARLYRAIKRRERAMDAELRREKNQRRQRKRARKLAAVKASTAKRLQAAVRLSQQNAEAHRQAGAASKNRLTRGPQYDPKTGRALPPKSDTEGEGEGEGGGGDKGEPIGEDTDVEGQESGVEVEEGNKAAPPKVHKKQRRHKHHRRKHKPKHSARGDGAGGAQPSPEEAWYADTLLTHRSPQRERSNPGDPETSEAEGTGYTSSSSSATSSYSSSSAEEVVSDDGSALGSAKPLTSFRSARDADASPAWLSSHAQRRNAARKALPKAAGYKAHSASSPALRGAERRVPGGAGRRGADGGRRLPRSSTEAVLSTGLRAGRKFRAQNNRRLDKFKFDAGGSVQKARQGARAALLMKEDQGLLRQRPNQSSTSSSEVVSPARVPRLGNVSMSPLRLGQASSPRLHAVHSNTATEWLQAQLERAQHGVGPNARRRTDASAGGGAAPKQRVERVANALQDSQHALKRQAAQLRKQRAAARVPVDPDLIYQLKHGIGARPPPMPAAGGGAGLGAGAGGPLTSPLQSARSKQSDLASARGLAGLSRFAKNKPPSRAYVAPAGQQRRRHRRKGRR